MTAIAPKSEIGIAIAIINVERRDFKKNSTKKIKKLEGVPQFRPLL